MVSLIVIVVLPWGCSKDSGRLENDNENDNDNGNNQGLVDGGHPDGGGSGHERPSGEVAEIRQGEPLVVDNERRRNALEAYESLDKDELDSEFDPEDLYETYNEFALAFFGPYTQLELQNHMGGVLDFVVSADWIHVSRNSAAIGFETTLPVRGYIEYGTDEQDLDSASDETERYFFQQIHHLRDLDEDTTYYYRLVGRGDDGETIVSHVRSFTTETGSGRIMVPGNLDGPPYVLDESDATYLLTEDITAEGTAVVIADQGITLDLNGRTITFGTAPVETVNPDGYETAACGIWARSSGLSDIKIVNGRIREGDGANESTSNGGLNAVYLSGVESIEIAGLSVEYRAAETAGLFFRYPSGRVHLHRTRITDKGYQVLDRHGAGVRAVRVVANDPDIGEMDDFEFNNNLVARTRQNGISRAQLMRDNEIWVDSWSTNSFAVQPFSRVDHQAGTVRRNKVFMSGYNPIGFGWAHLDLFVEENLVRMEGASTSTRRYYESWGEMDAVSAFRITNYGSGGQVRENLVYRNNVVFGRARGGGIMRGTMFYTDYSISDTLFENNFVYVSDDDGESLDTAPIVTQGVYANRENHLPAYYVDNVISSNIANVRFGDSYGRGDRHIFLNCTFIGEGDHPDYHTFVFDAGFDSNRHEVIDPVFVGRAAYDDVWWRRTSTQSFYSVGWTLTVNGPANETVQIIDLHGEEVFSGNLGGEGEISVELIAVTIRPAEWEESGSTFEVQDRFGHQKIFHTPHEVTVGGETRTVELDESMTIDF